MKEGDLIRATYTDGSQLEGCYIKDERGFVVIQMGDVTVPIRHNSARFEVIKKDKKILDKPDGT
jgi:hypothetical protein